MRRGGRRSGEGPSALALLLTGLLLAGCGSFKRLAYEGFDRDSWQQPGRVIAALEIGPGSRVADIGAGGGYFSFKLAEAVGATGRVYAVDVDEDMLAYLEERAEEEGARNVEVVRGEYDDPRLPEGELDLVFTSNTYHHIEDRPQYFARVARALAPGGRLAVLELDGRSWFPRTFGHYTPKQTIVDEMMRAGYRSVADHDFIDRQSFLVFAPERQPAP